MAISKFEFDIRICANSAWEQDQGVATLTFNRPERMNALSTPIMEGILHGLPRLAGDSAVRVIVLTGAGRAFCAGGNSRA